MITINLLPEAMRPVKRTPLPYMITGALGVLALLAMAGAWLLAHQAYAAQQEELRKAQTQLTTFKEIIDSSNKMEQEKKKLEPKVQVICEIASDRVIWSEQLWSLSRLTPDNIWYSGITVDMRSFKESTPIEDPKTKEIKLKTISVKKPILEIKGFIVPDKDASTQINPLTWGLENDPAFSKTFRMQPPKLDYADMYGMRVRSFTLEYLVKTLEPSEKPKEKQAGKDAAKKTGGAS